jgi:hypothetical protein
MSQEDFRDLKEDSAAVRLVEGTTNIGIHKELVLQKHSQGHKRRDYTFYTSSKRSAPWFIPFLE